MTKLKLAMLSAETAAHLAAIIIDYTHEEIMIVFQELKSEVLIFNRRCKRIDAD